MQHGAVLDLAAHPLLCTSQRYRGRDRASAMPMLKQPYVFAEDLTKENLATLQEICKEEFELSPSTELVYSALATRIRERVEKSFESGKGWNVVVGRSFGAFVTQKIKCYAYLSVYAGVNVLAWKS